MQSTKNSKETATTQAEDKLTIRARQRAIGRELRRFFDNVIEEPLPEEFLDLLKQIDGTSEGDEEGKKSP